MIDKTTFQFFCDELIRRVRTWQEQGPENAAMLARLLGDKRHELLRLLNQVDTHELLLDTFTVTLLDADEDKDRQRRLYNLLEIADIRRLRDLVGRTEQAMREVLRRSPHIESDLEFLRQALAGHDLTFAEFAEPGGNE